MICHMSSRYVHLYFEQLNMHSIGFVWWQSAVNVSVSYQRKVVHTLCQPEHCLAVFHSCLQLYNYSRGENEITKAQSEEEYTGHTTCFFLYFPTTFYSPNCWPLQLDLQWRRTKRGTDGEKNKILSLSSSSSSIQIRPAAEAGVWSRVPGEVVWALLITAGWWWGGGQLLNCIFPL